jgi:hypothetical protein
MKRNTMSDVASHAKAQAMLRTEITPIVQASDRNRPKRSATQPKKMQPITWPT